MVKAGLKLGPALYRQAEIPPVAPIAAPGEAPAPPTLPMMPGTILAQQPAAGARVEAGGTIQFTLAQ